MPRARILAALSACLLARTWSPGADAQVPSPVGAEFLVNTYNTGDQRDSDIAVDAEGDFVVVWRSEAEDGSNSGVFGRRFHRSGSPQGASFLVNSHTVSYQSGPSVGVDADGDFVVVWHSQSPALRGIFLRRFDSSGAPLATEFQVSTLTSAQYNAAVAREAGGDFIVAWTAGGRDGSSSAVAARRFTSSGSPQGGEFIVNSYTIGIQRNPSVATDADGDFVITWESDNQDGSSYGIFGQRFASSGAKQGSELQINSYVTGYQFGPDVAVNDAGFVVVWVESSTYPGDVVARRFDSAGTPAGGEFPVAVDRSDHQSQPSVDSDADGDFVIAWHSQGQDGSGYGVFVRFFEQSLVALNLDLQVNSSIADDQEDPVVGVDDDGDFVVAWTGEGGTGLGDIFARRFEVTQQLDVDGDGMYLPLTDGLLLLRFGFGFTGATLINGAVGPGCTRCDAPSITAYLQSLL